MTVYSRFFIAAYTTEQAQWADGGRRAAGDGRVGVCITGEARDPPPPTNGRRNIRDPPQQRVSDN